MVKPAAFTGNGESIDLVAVDVDLHQRRGGDLLEQQAVRVDQKMMLRPRHAGGDVGEDHVVPAMHRDQAIGGGEVFAHRPFLGADLVFHGTEVVGRGHLSGGGAHGGLRRKWR
jgi:hypothetical protein